VTWGCKMHRFAGFSLLEMLVVLVIMGLLAGLVGPRLFDRADMAKAKTAETQIDMIKSGLQLMRLDINRFPSTDEGLALLNRKPTDARLAENWAGPYLEEALPLDPWDRPYRYLLSPSALGLPFSLYSLGADGVPGGEGVDADVGYLPDG
jgi:general secretion pathway protein G